jgi:hypothetical protein
VRSYVHRLRAPKYAETAVGVTDGT